MANDTIKFTLPPFWTLGHWDLYQEGQADYQNKRAEQNKNSTPLVSRYFGVKKLIQAGIVKVEAPQAILTMLMQNDSNYDQVPVYLAGLIGRQVGGALERDIAGPLPDSLKTLFGISETPSATPNPDA